MVRRQRLCMTRERIVRSPCSVALERIGGFASVSDGGREMKLVRQNQGIAGGRVIGNAASVVVDEPLQLRRYVDRGRRGAGVGSPAVCPDCDSYVIDDMQPHRCAPAFRRR